MQEVDVTEAEVRDALHALDPLWDELFPAGAGAAGAAPDGAGRDWDPRDRRYSLRVDGLSGVVHEMAAREAIAA